jgi:hypothetical protein
LAFASKLLGKLQTVGSASDPEQKDTGCLLQKDGAKANCILPSCQLCYKIHTPALFSYMADQTEEHHYETMEQ